MSARYEIQETWSTVYGRWGYRIYDRERRVFVSPWFELRHRAELVLGRMLYRIAA